MRAERIRRRIIGQTGAWSLGGKMRARRFAMLADLFPDLGGMRVLDIGGVPSFWRRAPVRPYHVTLLNTFAQSCSEPWMEAMVGDGCDPPEGLPEVDLVVSNSVIEHVGGHWRRQAFAATVEGAASRYWVQTPYRYFPLEPHYLCPGVQHLPVSLQAGVVRSWPLAWGKGADRSRALARVMSIELLSATQMRAYFPGGTLCRERFGGLTKSLIAIRQ